LGSFLSEEGKREEEGKGTRGKKRKKEEEKNIKGIGILMKHYTALL